MRVIDVDFVGYGRCDRPAEPGQACSTVLYDAVLVKNTGGNYMLWNLEEGWNCDPHVASAYQLVDREKDAAFSSDTIWWSAYLSVAVDNEYDTDEFLTPTDVLFWHDHDFQRVIDLELDPAVTPGDPGYPSYYTVNALP